MYRFIFSLLLIFTFIGSDEGQSPQVFISENLKLSHNEVIDKFLMSKDGAYYLKATSDYSLSKDEIFLQKIDHDLNLVFSKVLTTKEDKYENLDVEVAKNQIFMILAEINRKGNFFEHSVVPVNLNGSLGKIVDLGRFKYIDQSDRPEYQISFSQDSTKVAFVSYQDKDKGKNLMQVSISMLSNEMLELWTKKYTLQKSQKETEIISTAINNAGKVYLLVKEYTDKDAKEYKKVKDAEIPAYKLKLLIFQNGQEVYDEVDLEIDKAFLNQASLKTQLNGDISVLGLFSTTKKEYVNGVFTMSMSGISDTIFQQSLKLFDREALSILNDLGDTKVSKGVEGLSSRFEPINYTVLPDGSSYVTMEENYYYTNNTNNYYNYYPYYSRNYYRPGINVTTFVSNDLIFLKLAASGEISNITVIPKRQSFESNDLYTSAITFVNEDQYVAVYNEDKDNLKKKAGDRKQYISSLGDCVAVATSVSTDGQISTVSLFDKEDTRAILIPKYSKQINNKEVFFVAQRAGFFGSVSDRRVGILRF